MSTTNNLTRKRNTKSSATRAQRARRMTPRPRTGTGLPALDPRTTQPATYQAPSVDRRPRAHDVGHAIGEQSQEVIQRRFVGGCVGYIYPTVRHARHMGGSAGWVEASA